MPPSPKELKKTMPVRGSEHAKSDEQYQLWKDVYTQLEVLLRIPLTERDAVPHRYKTAEKIMLKSLAGLNLMDTSEEYQKHLWTSAVQAMRRIAATMIEIFGQPIPDLSKCTAWQPLSTQRLELTEIDAALARRYCIWNNVDAAAKPYRPDEERIKAGVDALIQASGASGIVVDGPRKKAFDAVLSYGDGDKEDMFGYSLLALIAMAQCLSTRFGGKTVELWSGQQVPGTG